MRTSSWKCRLIGDLSITTSGRESSVRGQIIQSSTVSWPLRRLSLAREVSPEGRGDWTYLVCGDRGSSNEWRDRCLWNHAVGCNTVRWRIKSANRKQQQEKKIHTAAECLATQQMLPSTSGEDRVPPLRLPTNSEQEHPGGLLDWIPLREISRSEQTWQLGVIL